ncbi:unnamed protein product [Prunus armeniaca]
MVLGLPRLENFGDVCEGCVTGKAHREAFDKNEVWKASQPLELVHSDVCSPMQVTTIGGNNISSLSLMIIQGCVGLKAMIELQSGFQIKKLRTYRGGEYTSNEFSKFCEDLVLERQLTMAYSPQQNGVPERKNRTIVEMARTMIYEKRMPIKFWGEAVNTAVYILNKYHTSALKNETPFEAFSGRKPRLRHKLEEIGENGVFVGYGNYEKGYRVFNMRTQKVIVPRSIIFDEKALWNWEANEEVHMSIPWDSSEKARITEERRSLNLLIKLWIHQVLDHQPKREDILHQDQIHVKLKHLSFMITHL